MLPETLSDNSLERLEQSILHAAHLLPTQGPIEVFVHHNTLHVFEDENFDQAVVAGFQRFGGQPFLSESEYRKLVSSGRIKNKDLRSVLSRIYQADQEYRIGDLAAVSEIRMAMLQHPLSIGPDAELRWIVAETEALDQFLAQTGREQRCRIVTETKRSVSENTKSVSDYFSDIQDWRGRFGDRPENWNDSAWASFSLHYLYRVCRDLVARGSQEKQPASTIRPRDALLQATGEDSDRVVHEILIRFCGAFVDQGYSDWTLPNRDIGFYESFLDVYANDSLMSPAWMHQLHKELRVLKDGQVSALESIQTSIADFGIPDDQVSEFLTQTMLALRGWAGIIWQLESGVDWVVHKIPQGSLVGLLAIQLILEKHAVQFFGNEDHNDRRTCEQTLIALRCTARKAKNNSTERDGFLLFQIAQVLGWSPERLAKLPDDQVRRLSAVIQSFTGFERRRVFHHAYELKYRNAACDAIVQHAQRRKSEAIRFATERPNFQIVTCIDDREESFRRHMEEVDSNCETFGAAGFFAVAIYYRGAADSFYKPLCPGVITPDHYVQEDVGYSFEGQHQSRSEMRKRLGFAKYIFHTHSRNFLGGVLTGIVGSLATAPLVARVLFPRLTARLSRTFGQILQPPPFTKLQLERYNEQPGPENGSIGFTLDEMAGVVVRLLQDMGLTKSNRFSRLFIVCGHGSSSLNNPHESAYCCGACAGKRGGPNARAFAAMANDYRVRIRVAEKGIEIPEDTVFVGAYHNTCDDSVVYYDLDMLPASHRQDFESARQSIETARRRNAHERCRRFVSAPLTLTDEDALKHVEARSQDISQARPEYNHATNALCIVGNRNWTRGLFLDRRSFLTSYDPAQDTPESDVLFRILSAAIPVCAGINLEYYFSCVDHKVYGSGSKLPHNVVSMLGVMEGTSSDLRTGLYKQMVEIHEPLRILFVIETTPEAMSSIMQRNAQIGKLCRGDWIQLAVFDAEQCQLHIYEEGEFKPFAAEGPELKWIKGSRQCYEGSRDHLPFYSIQENCQ